LRRFLLSLPVLVASHEHLKRARRTGSGGGRSDKVADFLRKLAGLFVVESIGQNCASSPPNAFARRVGHAASDGSV
jgi:hypothetical protein